MTKKEQLFYLAVNLLSAILLVMETGGTGENAKSVVLVVLSLLMIPEPVTFLPVLFVSSWSISFVAMPGIAAFFYYLALFFVSLILDRKQSVFYFESFPAEAKIALLLSLWIFVTGFFSLSGVWNSALKVALYVVPVFLVSRSSIRDLEFCRSSMVVIAAVFSVYFFYISLFAPVEFINETDDFTIDPNHVQFNSLGRNINPNTASQYVLLLFIILYSEAFRAKKYWIIILAACNIVTLMYLGSRTAFFSMVVVAVVYLILILKTSVVNKILLLSAMVGVFLVIYSQFGRFERSDRLRLSTVYEDEGSGRFVTWTILFNNVIPKHLMKGIGVGRQNYVEAGVYMRGTYKDADNLYIDVLTQMGIIGLALFILFYVLVLRNLIKYRKVKRDWDFLLAVFLAYLVEGLGETVFDTPMFWFLGLMVMIAINDLKESDEEELESDEEETESDEEEPVVEVVEE